MANQKLFYFLVELLVVLGPFGRIILCQEENVEPNSGNSDEDVQQSYLDLFVIKPEDQNQASSDSANSAQINRIAGSLSKSCSRGTFYYSFHPECQEDVSILEQLLLDEKNTTEMINLANTLRDDPEVHPKAWYTALSRVSIQRDDLRGLWKPSPVNVFPEDFIDNRAIQEAVKEEKQSNFLRDEKECIVVDERFADDNVDRDLWYFREDIQVNSHHWFWHITYPSIPPSTSSSQYIPDHQDRRGELFYYLHHSMMARYNAERLSNGLPVISPVVLSPGYIMNDPYYPHLDGTNSGTAWKSRDRPTPLPESVVMRTSNGQLSYVYLNRTIEVHDRLIAAIDNGFLEAYRGRVALRPPDGIDRLVDTTEASVFSTNLNYYGSMHSNGHILISQAHEPNNPDIVPTVMADSATSMRDFIFYAWHAFIDDFFDKHKRLLAPYRPTRSEYQLVWSNVVIDSVNVQNGNNGPINTLRTYWSYKKFNLTTGLGFDRNSRQAAVPLCVKHLDHEDFIYEIKIRSNGPQVATIRILLAPSTDANGVPLSMEQQRGLYFALDTFRASLKSGSNIIRRDSRDSTLTIPWGEGIYNVDQENKRTFCGCGWPYHLLLPKGKESGMLFDLFIMVTNAQEDYAAYEYKNPSSSSYCHAAPILCGIPRQKYPDLKPMGYPFDRIPYTVYEQNTDGTRMERPVANINEYVRFVPNSFTTKLTIRHVNDIIVS